MTLANKLTILRLILGLATFLCLWTNRPAYFALGGVLYVAAILTDWIDGYIARKTQTISPFGAMADPIADKVLVIGVLLACLRIGELDIPVWAVFLVIVRELVIGGLRALIGAMGKILAAERAGKLKMVVQSVAVLVILGVLVARDTLLWPLPDWMNALPRAMAIVSCAAAWLSAAIYLFDNRQALQRSWNSPQNT